MNTEQLKPLTMGKLMAICQALNVKSAAQLIELVESCVTYPEGSEKQVAEGKLTDMLTYFTIAKTALVTILDVTTSEAEEMLPNFPATANVVRWLISQAIAVVNPEPASTDPN